jgi:hypothetical protein
MPIYSLADQVDLKALEAAEYSDEDYESYSGEIPPTGYVFSGTIKKMWLSSTQNDDPMLIVLHVSDTDDDYYGLPSWDYLTLTEDAKFRWAPYFEVTGLSLRDVVTKINLADEDDNIGSPVLNIGKWKLGGRIRFVTKKDFYDQKWKCKASKYLDPEEESPNGHKPSRAKSSASPARGRRTREPEPEEEEEDEEANDSPPPRGRRATSSATRKPAARKPAARGRRAAKASEGYDDSEPPFLVLWNDGLCLAGCPDT